VRKEQGKDNWTIDYLVESPSHNSALEHRKRRKPEE
jgi:hypothetical protein